jgi:hypothetical protein
MPLQSHLLLQMLHSTHRDIDSSMDIHMDTMSNLLYRQHMDIKSIDIHVHMILLSIQHTKRLTL